ncbi:MAG: PIG-L deacetylase family protein [Armatimonadota bacterium]
MTWLDDLREAQRSGQPLALHEQPLPGNGRALALAPHPDDPDAIAVTLRLLAAGGWEMHWAIVTPSWSGVEDRFVGPDRQAKAQVREVEQADSARLFGLPPEHLYFLRLAEDAEGELDDTAENRRRLFAFLDAQAPDLVLLPNREDNHPTHRLNYRWLAEWAREQARPIIALGNEDPKTRNFQPDLIIIFGEETAAWKAEMAECHRSQSARNQATRGITFAERLLGPNRACPGLQPGQYAERFQVEFWNAQEG